MHSRTRIKICGVRDLDTARCVVDAGADAVGFVFVPTSPRYIEPARAWEILGALPPMVATVGLFVDAGLEEHHEVEQSCPTDYTQLHGAESVEVVRECGPRVIKAVRFEAATIRDELARWAEVDEVDAILVDGGAGGEGRTLDWAALRGASDAAGAKPLILAGGLTVENVGEAVRTVRPFAVDVSSGVETPGRRGHKDPDRIFAFCEAVRTADSALRRR